MADTQFEISARITRNVRITVDAETPEEAMAKFNSMDWADEGMGETTDWEAISEPRQSYP